MGRRPWTRIRSERTSTEVQSNTSFSTSWKWATAQDVRDYDAIAMFFFPDVLVQVTAFRIAIAWSDDGSTIGFGDDNQQQSDFNLSNFTDGSFNPKPYNIYMSVPLGTAVSDQYFHWRFPVKAGYCRIGVQLLEGTDGQGLYGIRTQRLVV